MHYVERPEYSDEPWNINVPLANICGYKVFAGKDWTGYYPPKMEFVFNSEEEAARANLSFGFEVADVPFSLSSERVGSKVILAIEYIGQFVYSVRQKMVVYYNGATIGWFWLYPAMAEGILYWGDYTTKFQLASIGPVINVETSLGDYAAEHGTLTLDKLERESDSLYFYFEILEGVCKFVEPAGTPPEASIGIRTNGSAIHFSSPDSGESEIAGNGSEFYFYGSTPWQEIIDQEPARSEVYGWIINLFSVQFFERIELDVELDDY